MTVTPPVVEIELDWGLAPGRSPGQMGVTVMILESDGTFVPGEWDGAAHEIYGKPGITEIGRGSALRNAAASVVMHERFQIDLTGATVGRELFLRFNKFRAEGGVVPYVQVDNITISPASVVNQSPQDGAVYIPVWRTSPENDLVFNVVDKSIIAVDVLFGPENDPNLSSKPALKIVEGMPVTQGLNTVTLETELTARPWMGDGIFLESPCLRVRWVGGAFTQIHGPDHEFHNHTGRPLSRWCHSKRSGCLARGRCCLFCAVQHERGYFPVVQRRQSGCGTHERHWLCRCRF